MGTWIALLRGINVGGRNVVRMADLVAAMESAGFADVATYIQSGNIVFDASETSPKALEATISGTIDARFGFRPEVCVLSREALQSTIDANPFIDAAVDPKTLHFFFLRDAPSDVDTGAIDAAKHETERYAIGDGAFYLLAPDGIGRSKLAASAERHLGVATTARNYRTVLKFRDMMASR